MRELRCPGTMHARIDIEAQTLEVKCKRRRCGAEPGVVVLHTFDIDSGRLLNTSRYQDPASMKGGLDGSRKSPTSVRAA